MTNKQIIDSTKRFVKKTLENAEGGHDWFHILRVYNNAMLIAKDEDVDEFVVALGALLHDIADSKFNDGDETLGPKIAREFVFKHNVDSLVIEQVIKIIENISIEICNVGENTDEISTMTDSIKGSVDKFKV